MNIFEKIKEERIRLGFTQDQFAAAIGATRGSVINWETGNAQPPASILAKMALQGLDARYVITGRRSVAVAEVDLLPNDERGLLDSYRRCSPAAKKSLVQTAALLATDQAMPGITMRAGKNSKQVGSINAKGDVTF